LRDDFGEIIDLGAVRRRQRKNKIRTQVGSVKGTLGYLSPEQAQALNTNLDHRTDIYGLEATLYRILTGTVPYSGTSVE
ncbi:MAG: hypothetical protein ACKN82_15110, partial [Pirellula sp.]